MPSGVSTPAACQGEFSPLGRERAGRGGRRRERRAAVLLHPCGFNLLTAADFLWVAATPRSVSVRWRNRCVGLRGEGAGLSVPRPSSESSTSKGLVVTHRD
jgi:hypothetical protein